MGKSLVHVDPPEGRSPHALTVLHREASVLRRTHRFRQHLFAAVTLLVLGLAAGCGSEAPEAESAASTSTASTTSAEASPSTSASPTPTTSAAPNTSAAPSPPRVRFDVGMVRWVEVNKLNKGGQANVHVVAGLTNTGALLEVAEGCVEHYLDEEKAAFCHVWGTEANYAARDPRGAGDLLCWTHYVGVPLAGGDPVVTTSASYSYEIEGCPDAVV